MFLKLGDLQGGSQDRRHPGEIEVLGWSWGASNSGLAEETTTGARFLAVTFTKEMDRASTGLVELCLTGHQEDRAVLTIRKSGEEAVEFYKLVLEGVTVSSYTVAGAGEGIPMENVMLSFERVGVEYLMIAGDGKPSRFAWDVTANQEGGVTFPGDLAQEDADGDNLPDDWEAMFGFDPAVNDAGSDGDGDGATNYEEYVAGTNPTDVNEVLRARLSPFEGGTVATLGWQAAAGKQYRVLVSPSLDEAFQEHSVFTAAEDGMTSVPVPGSLVTGFFRIEVVADQ